MEGESRSSKRPRDESAEFPETKRLREPDTILEILDDDAAGRDPTDHDFDDVITNLVGEVAAPATGKQEVDGQRQLDLGYLLEASDDDLGLPPAAGSSSLSSSTGGGDEVEVAGDAAEAAGFDPIWVFEDEISCPYDGFGFGIGTEFDDGVIFDGGLFDYGDVVYGLTESWRTEPPPSM